MESVVSGVESELGKGGDVGSDGGSNEGDGGGVSEAVKQGGEWSGRVEGGYGSVAERLGMLQCSSLPSAFFIFFSLSLSLSFSPARARALLLFSSPTLRWLSKDRRETGERSEKERERKRERRKTTVHFSCDETQRPFLNKNNKMESLNRRPGRPCRGGGGGEVGGGGRGVGGGGRGGGGDGEVGAT